MMLNYFALTYAVFGIVAVTLTIFLARVLSKNGEVFLRDVFSEQPDLAHAVNQLLVVGFYLFNFGYACMLVEYNMLTTIDGAIVVLAGKLGGLLISLAVMHFINVFIFHRVRRRALLRTHARPPVTPTFQLGQPEQPAFPGATVA